MHESRAAGQQTANQMTCANFHLLMSDTFYIINLLCIITQV